MEIKEVEAALEAMLFASGDPVSSERLRQLLDLDEQSCDSLMERLIDRYSFERRGMRILKLENAYQMVSAPEYASFVRRLLEERRPGMLSKPAIETLAIVAYFQPTTRAYIDQIRGVDSTNTLASLVDRGLVHDCGRLEVVGRPIQYATTPGFLRAFGLSSLDELPELPFGEDEGQLSLLSARAEEEAEEVRAAVTQV